MKRELMKDIIYSIIIITILLFLGSLFTFGFFQYNKAVSKAEKLESDFCETHNLTYQAYSDKCVKIENDYYIEKRIFFCGVDKLCFRGES